MEKNEAKTLLEAVRTCDELACTGYFNYEKIFFEWFQDYETAEFLSEWYPETVSFALENMCYDYGTTKFYRLTDETAIDENIAELKEDFGENYELYVTLIQDAAFEGVIFLYD